MREPPSARLLDDGRRLHLRHGPIDLVIEARGRSDAVRDAYAAASRRFASVLPELCDELPAIRRPARPGEPGPGGPVARRMHAAVLPFAAATFITPMAAVAGAVADEILAAMAAAAALDRASVNNGGDIALYLAPGEALTIGMVERPDAAALAGRPSLFGRATLRAEDGIGGIATSGRHGRSFSCGIADAVTVLARTAAAADAAATVVANAVDLDHPGIVRVPAASLQTDSDLGQRLVTRDVPALRPGEIEAALASGLALAEALVAWGLIAGAALHLQGRTTVAGPGAGTLSQGERAGVRGVTSPDNAQPSPQPSPARERVPRRASRACPESRAA